MTVPKGVTVDDLTVKTKEKNGQIMNQFYYSGQFVGYLTTPKFSPTPAGDRQLYLEKEMHSRPVRQRLKRRRKAKAVYPILPKYFWG